MRKVVCFANTSHGNRPRMRNRCIDNVEGAGACSP